ncbi:hypothetical protein LWT77_24470, partial [Enterobacter hormaechei]|nr:hypothetical protein [Enterobacter hormaechei]
TGRAGSSSGSAKAEARAAGGIGGPVERSVSSEVGKGGVARLRLQAGLRSPAFRIAFAFFFGGVSIVAASLAIPHEFAFFELGYLFTLSIYDLVLA